MTYELTWEEVQDAAEKMLRIWVGGGEAEWAQECWSHFRAAGLTGAATLLERTESEIRLLCLTKIYHEFCATTWDENPDQPLVELADYLEVNPVAIGILAAKAGFSGDEEDSEHELLSGALQAASDAQRPLIHACLVKALGGAPKVYERMRRTRGTEDPDGDEWAVTSTNAAAFDFIEKRFHHG